MQHFQCRFLQTMCHKEENKYVLSSSFNLTHHVEYGINIRLWERRQIEQAAPVIIRCRQDAGSIRCPAERLACISKDMHAGRLSKHSPLASPEVIIAVERAAGREECRDLHGDGTAEDRDGDRDQVSGDGERRLSRSARQPSRESEFGVRSRSRVRTWFSPRRGERTHCWQVAGGTASSLCRLLR